MVPGVLEAQHDGSEESYGAKPGFRIRRCDRGSRAQECDRGYADRIMSSTTKTVI